MQGREGNWVRHNSRYVRLYEADQLPLFIKEQEKVGRYFVNFEGHGLFDFRRDPVLPFIKAYEP
jgi:hypothetical protein